MRLMNELNWTQIVSSIDRPLVESDTHAEKCMESRQESNCLLIRHLVKREKKKTTELCIYDSGWYFVGYVYNIFFFFFNFLLRIYGILLSKQVCKQSIKHESKESKCQQYRLYYNLSLFLASSCVSMNEWLNGAECTVHDKVHICIHDSWEVLFF